MLRFFPLMERGAEDERNFVKEGVSWDLRMAGRTSPVVHAAAVELSGRLAASDHPAKRWIGKGALKELTSPAVKKRMLAKK